MPYLIDGHNLISYLPDISLDDPDDEGKLVTKLKGFAARVRKKIIVVFDNGLPGGESKMSNHSVKVIFASSKRTNADNVIKERIRAQKNPVTWTVVSSDHEVLNVAKQHRMKAMPCPEFATLLRRPVRPKTDPSEATNPYLSPEEVDEWMQLFGGEN
jgi:predicted RNA-binding protein with PIN domain